MNIKKKYIGDKAFYKMMIAIALPIMAQNGISNFVNLLDNLMIGQLGPDAISGVAISNQLIFVYYLIIFGATAGVGIFTAQFYGMGDTEGVRHTFRFKLVANLILSAVCIGIFLTFSETLVGLFLKGEGESINPEIALAVAKNYITIMMISLIPNGITHAYAGTLRDTGHTRVPMVAAFAAVFVNLIGNLLLINGYLGLPKLGASGAAIATVISRFVELGVLVIYTGTHSAKHPFIIGVFKHFKVPGYLVKKFIIKALPLMANETLWATGMTFLNQCYSYKSLDAVNALSIESTIWNLLGVAFLAMGEAVGIIVGQVLGSGEIDKARDYARKLTAFTTVCGIMFGIVMCIISPFFPLVYNVTQSERDLATKFIFIYGALMPFYSYTHASYFTIRAGGRTGITMIFDSCFVWVISVPTAFCLSRFSSMDVVLMLVIVQSLEVIKCVIGGAMVHSGIWARNIVADAANEQKV